MSTEARPQIGEIYANINDELNRLDDFLQNEFNSEEPFICQLLSHIDRFRGKRIRPALLLMVAKLLRPDISPDQVKIAAVIELIHTATLVHDDILDDARLRRGVETIHRRWGERAGVLLGDFLYSRAFSLSTEVPGMASILSATTHIICEGELLQIGNRYRPDIGEDVYLEIIRKKTASLHAIACYLGGVLSGINSQKVARLHDFGTNLGMAFQIIDDCLDYSGDEAVVGKSLGTDLRQGKVTLPLIYLLESLEKDQARVLLEALRQPLTAAMEEQIARQVRERGALRVARDRALGYIESARSNLAGMDSGIRDCLDRVADYVVRRQK